ncbi:MAG: hypothetical protein QXW80_03095 [Candidatus Micrarchaeia archaeon]|uniref:hypothetical protein n=1 Tax=Saccharolobus sp. TaxID=2100761 RepID=UPI00316FA3E7
MSERRRIKETRPIETEYFEKVEQLPPTRREIQSKYFNIVKQICQLSKGYYRIKLEAIRQGLTFKSAYPSIDRVLRLIAKEKNLDYDTFKEQYMRIRIANKELFIEKLKDEPI